MEVKITGNQAVYQKMMNSTKSNDKPADASIASDKKLRHDEITISGEGIKKQEAAQAAQKVYQSIGEDAKADRIEVIKRQIQDGTYQIPAEVLAGKILSGI